MDEEKKKKLVELGPDVLADALIRLADNDDKANRLVERLTSDPDDIIKKIKRRISGLKRRKRFIHWRESRRFAAELDDLLDDLEEINPEPSVGMALVASFIETDHAFFGNCDDSSGHISNIYRYAASSLFAQYASRCRDKKKVLDLLIKTYSYDPYSIREGLIEKSLEMLGKDEAKNAINLFEILAGEEGDEHQKRHFQRAIESLARQTGDAKLFERVRFQSKEKPGISSCLDIARVYLESGDPHKALEWVNRIPSHETYMDRERRDLLQQIYERLGDPSKQDMLALEIEDWEDMGEHGMYHVWLNQVHGKKSGFWRHYRSE